jgi:hypothetical protein
MREGSFTYYIVQFKPGRGENWRTADIGHMLFDGLSYGVRQGKLGDRYRTLLDPQHKCWQLTGSDGYLDVEDAIAALGPCRYRRPKYKFRVAKRSISQVTEPIHA